MGESLRCTCESDCSFRASLPALFKFLLSAINRLLSGTLAAWVNVPLQRSRRKSRRPTVAGISPSGMGSLETTYSSARARTSSVERMSGGNASAPSSESVSISASRLQPPRPSWSASIAAPTRLRILPNRAPSIRRTAFGGCVPERRCRFNAMASGADAVWRVSVSAMPLGADAVCRIPVKEERLRSSSLQVATSAE